MQLLAYLFSPFKSLFSNNFLEGVFWMVRFIELIDDVKLEQPRLNRSPQYIEQCMLRLNKFSKYVIGELQVEDVEDSKSTHIKGYIRYLQ